jgi:hypothetical protein
MDRLEPEAPHVLHLGNGQARSAAAAAPRQFKHRHKARQTIGQLQQRREHLARVQPRPALNRQMVGKAALLLGGPRALAVKAVAETVAPRPTAKGTLSAGGAQGPAMPKRLEQQGLAAPRT